MIDVLVVEDSRVVREYLVHLLQADPDLRVSDAVERGEEALEILARHPPQVVLMDVHLPGIDGYEATRRIMASTPVPIVVCTAEDHFDQVQTALRALEAGAVAAVRKPTGPGSPGAEQDALRLVSTVKLMAEVRVVRRWNRPRPPAAAAALPKGLPRGQAAIVAIGASTGGPPVIREILAGLDGAALPPVLVVQHISAGFARGFAEWLASSCGRSVTVARHGEAPLPGHVYVAPDDLHLRVGPHGVLLTSLEPPVGGLRPSVGVLFRSVAEHFGAAAVGVLLTGMGRDGAAELKLMADAGALTIAQDQATSVVFGMPGEAVHLGAARLVLPPARIAEILAGCARPPLPEGARHV